MRRHPATESVDSLCKWLASCKDERGLVGPLLLLFSAFVLSAAFALIASEMVEGETRAFDEAIFRLFRPQLDPAVFWGPPWLTAAMSQITPLGSTTVITLVTVLAGGMLLVAGRRNAAWSVTLCSASGAAVLSVLKDSFGRVRPTGLIDAALLHNMSFPSGHSSMSAVVYITLGALVAASRPRRIERAYILACAIAVTLAIGVSRVYLGVHWATDVVAGWAFGAAWALVSLALMHFFIRDRAHAAGRAAEST